MSGNTYYFPFRVLLEPVRKLEEPLVRAEFAYVAENLLLRGGYRRTHFQADQTTLQAVSQMGNIYKDKVDNFRYSVSDLFEPKFTKNSSLIKNPQVFLFQELILQSLIRKYLARYNNLQEILSAFGITLAPERFEILGEKALPEGHVDLFLKESIPIGESKKIVVEVKTSTATKKDVDQVLNYVEELAEECLKGILIAARFSKQVINYARQANIGLLTYHLGVDLQQAVSFEKCLDQLRLKYLS